jgi:hypothetical protein
VISVNQESPCIYAGECQDNGNLSIYLFRDGNYIKSDTSPTFPNIPLTQIIPATIERAWQVGSVQALEEFEGAIAVANF